MKFSDIPANLVSTFIQRALQEDMPKGDITTKAIFQENKQVDFIIVAKQPCVVAGLELASQVFYVASSLQEDKNITDNTKIYNKVADGDKVEKGSVLIQGRSSIQTILAAERTALNLLQYLSGVATSTNTFVSKIAHTKAKVLDTRKILPLYRQFVKYAVVCGGGFNHRMSLSDMILIKDNHLHEVGVHEALKLAHEYRIISDPNIRIEIECENLQQVLECISSPYKADIIMLDNMDIVTLKKAVEIIGSKAFIEASGTVNLDTISKIAETGVDFISIGRVSHSVQSIDISLDIF